MHYIYSAKIEPILPHFRRERFENDKKFIVIPTDLNKVAYVYPLPGVTDQ